MIPNPGLVTGQLQYTSALSFAAIPLLVCLNYIERSSPAVVAPCLSKPKTTGVHLRIRGSFSQGTSIPHRPTLFFLSGSRYQPEFYTEVFLISPAQEEHFLRLSILFLLTLSLLPPSLSNNHGQTLTIVFPCPQTNTSPFPQVLTFHSRASSRIRARLLSTVNSIIRLVCPQRP